jgi:predicted O-methyltransferase YrrM
MIAERKHPRTETGLTNKPAWSARELLRPWIPPVLSRIFRKVLGTSSPRTPPPRVRFELPIRPLDELLPGILPEEVTVPAFPFLRSDEWGLPPAELICMAAICKFRKPRRILEIGTYMGTTTLVMAANSPEDTEILSLDLAPILRVGNRDPFAAGRDFHGSPLARKIRQLFGDSRTLDYSPYEGGMDLIFIDANHTYEFVTRDTDRAFRVLASGGIIIWDDYRWTEGNPECAGVTRCLNEISRTRKVQQVAGTRLAIYMDTTSR